MLAFFWFNPLMWVAAILSKRDNEMACDERAIEGLGIREGRRYGEVLIDLVDTVIVSVIINSDMYISALCL